VRENLAIRDLDVIAYAGIPLITAAGHALGSLCVIDHEPRAWTAEQLDTLVVLAASVVSEIELATSRAAG
jgi:GAF domain-containing protein